SARNRRRSISGKSVAAGFIGSAFLEVRARLARLPGSVVYQIAGQRPPSGKGGTGTDEAFMGLKSSGSRVPGQAGHDAPSAAALSTRAAAGDQRAWDEIVERYAPMVWSISTWFRLSDRDLEDVAQN